MKLRKRAARRGAAGAVALAAGLAGVNLVAPESEAWTAAPCQFGAGAGTLRLVSANSTGDTGTWSNNRAWGAIAATDAWDSSNAPNLVWNAGGFDGTIVIDINHPTTHHGVALVNCDAAGNYPSNTAWLGLGRHKQQPTSTWQHVTAHENGHALGLNHSGAAANNIMGSSWPNSSCNGCRTTPSGDDLAGMNSQYK